MKPKLFSKMTAAEKRVAIAKDVIKQINAGRFKPGIGYATRSDWRGAINQAELNANVHCYGCAAGAATLSCIRLGNRFTTSYCMAKEEAYQIMTQWFPRRQTLMIEAAYEGFVHGQYKFPKAFEFYETHQDPDSRIIAIFRNIIKNRGTFKP